MSTRSLWLACGVRGLRKYGIEMSEGELDALMRAVDKDNTGVINYHKFIRCVCVCV